MQPTQGYLNERLVRDFQRTQKWFEGQAHFRDKALPDADETDLQRQFAAFEAMLHSFVGSFFTTIERLDDVLQQANQRSMTSYSKPTSDQIEAALSMIGSPQHEAYFFARLDNPFWIQPLRERHVFEHPPPPEPINGGGIRYPHWPPSKYLARLASSASSEVAAILAGIETENVSIIGDLIDAASKMPVDVATQLVPRICRAARGGQLLDINFSDATKFCISLITGGEVDQATSLADALFTPRFREGEHRMRRRDEYWYEEGLGEVLPIMVAHRPGEFLLKLCHWLESTVKAHEHFDPRSGKDRSYVWRPAIEDHAQNRDRELPDIMVGFVRDGFEQAVGGDLMTLDDALAILERFRYIVFKRMRIHLINEFAEKAVALARQTIMDRTLFDDALEFKHEYAMLVGRRLDMLTPEERETWFAWVEAGPDTSDLADLDEQRRDHVRYWKFQKFHCVRQHLDTEQKAFYDGMLAEYGEPQLADLSIRFDVGWGHISPMTVDDLAGLSFGEVVKRVSSWKPGRTRGFKEPEVEGLASTFEKYLAGDPVRFSKEAKSLIGAPAVYVRTFIDQMAKAAKEGGDIDVGTVLDLCDWVLTRPVSERTTPKGRGPLADKDWQWTRDEIASFVQVLCKATTEDRPKYSTSDFRERFWSLIDRLCRDRAESYIVKDLEGQDPRAYDYLDVAINSPRGKAVEAALAYARWVADHIKKTEGGHEVVPGGFESMPEVRELLEWQIAPETRSFVGLAVIGAQLNLLYWIDKDWLAKNASRVFHLRGVEESPAIVDGWAAWNAFVVWVPAHIEYYRLFRDQYAYAVAQCSRVQTQSETREHPLLYFGQHLIVFYGRGQLGLDDDGGLLRRFLRDAHPDVRRYAISFVGRSFEGDKEVPGPVIDRFMALWDEYWRTIGKKDATERPDYWLFGAWFSSGKFPAEWAISRLEQFVEVVPFPEPDHSVAKQLAAVMRVDIESVVRILDRIIRTAPEGWRMYQWREPVKTILDHAMRAGGDARARAIESINHLGRRGYTELGGLLTTGER